MQRRKFLQTSALLAGATMIPQQVWLRNLLLPAGEWTTIRRNVGYYTERGGTIVTLLTPSSSVIVDTQFPEQVGNLWSLMKAKNAQPLDLLVNTHHHGDHTSGNIAFKDMVITHVAHANSKANQERVARDRDQLKETLLPDTVYTDKYTQRVGDETVSLHYFGAGHTDGDSMVHFEEANVVHTGDLMFNRRFPYIDKSSGADISNWIDVLKKARKTFDKDTFYVFGHSGNGYPVTGTADDLKVMAHFLKMSLRFVKKADRKGQTLDQLLESTQEIPGAPEYQGKGIERVLKAAWEEIIV